MNAGKTSERALAVEIQRLGTVTLEGVDWDVNQPSEHLHLLRRARCSQLTRAPLGLE